MFQWGQGRPSPVRPYDAYSPLFQISPLFSKFFLTFCKISEILPFPDKISYFHPPKFLTTFFFSHRPQISNFSSVLLHFPLIHENLLFPLLLKISPLFSNFCLHTLRT